MIVTCTSCQARFRIPDERIGPKGAKVRCSKCRNVFVVRPFPADEATAPPADPFAGQPAGGSDPFAPGPGLAGAGASADPSAASPPADPFAAQTGLPLGSGTGSTHLPVTDLSDLARGVAPPPAGLTSLAPPLPAATAPTAAPAESAAVTSADDLVLEEPSRASPVAHPAPLVPHLGFDLGGGYLSEPGPGEAASPEGRFEFGAPGTDLSEPGEPVPGLEMGSPVGAAPGGAGFAGADPFAAAASAERPGGEGPFGETAGFRPPTITEPLPPEAPADQATAKPAIALRRQPEADRQPGPLAPAAARSKRQGFLANAVSLAALLAVAGGLLSWWLRDAATPRPGPGTGPVAVARVSSGLYETAAGPPVLFVRGEVRSRDAAPLGRVAVRAEALVGGEVLARAEGLAGAVPGAEELAQIAGPEDAARLRARVASRAPRHLAPGASLPFLVVFDAVPEGYRDAVFRVVAEPLPGETARAP